ncbi:MAG: transposase, partial [Nitrospira sp.]|nr:transposase [Nitrospira sp.]
GEVSIHYTEEEEVPDPKPKGEIQPVIGVDKGFKEVLTDSDGTVYGEGFGAVLRLESDRLSKKNTQRNQLRDVAKKAFLKGKQQKSDKISKHNLGKKKYNRKKWQARKKIKTFVGRAVHEIFEKKAPELVVGEELNFTYSGGRDLPKKVKRYFSGWLKGVLQQVIEMRCLRSGASYVPVNAAYTSQVCSFCGCFGKRNGDTFHCLKEGCGKVVDADYNGARNVLKRYQDPDTGLFTPKQEVKRIVEERFRSAETVQPGLQALPARGVNRRAN